MSTVEPRVLPRVLVSGATGPGAGAVRGLTALATGLLAALTARGLDVSGHQIGPDQTAACYHALACGRPPRILDPYLVGEPRVVPLLLHGAAGAQVAVLQGADGPLDGTVGADPHGGDLRLARLTGTPVVLVVDAATDTAALTRRLAALPPRVVVGGLVLTGTDGVGHRAAVLTAAERAGVPVLGMLPGQPGDDPATLGLPAAADRAPQAVHLVSALAAQVAEHVDLDAVLALARAASPLPGPAWQPGGVLPAAHGRVVAVAGAGRVPFCFVEAVELLAAAGARVHLVDPRTDPALPAGTDALLLGGGYPETAVAELTTNVPLRADVAAFAAAGGPILAEGSGLLLLSREVDGAPMCGVVPGVARTTGTLVRAYRRAGDRCTGHKVTGFEWRRTVMTYDDPQRPATWQWTDEQGLTVRDGHKHGLRAAGQLQVHPAGHPWRLRFD